MADRVSALAGHYAIGHYGDPESHAVTLHNHVDMALHQIAAWSDTIDTVAQQIAAMTGIKAAPTPGVAAVGKHGTLLRVEPLKWWLLDTVPDDIAPEHGNTLDISHSRTRVQIKGERAAALLNRFLPLDLRDSSFPIGAVASSAIHHVGITLWRSEKAYELFIPRGFALSLWQLLVEVAEQFGLEIE